MYIYIYIYTLHKCIKYTLKFHCPEDDVRRMTVSRSMSRSGYKSKFNNVTFRATSVKEITTKH